MGLALFEASTEQFLVKASEIAELEALGFSRDEIFALVSPRRTLARRIAKGEKLTLVESDRVARLKRVVSLAERVFGNGEKAHRWLRKPSRPLDGAIPLALLVSETGAEQVTNALHAIDHGMYV
ncbi:MAG TPA: DUF2384 domain-containing protein [Rhizobiaceae bacterium]|nr:DUF2384 domain-containing protein [Rhizobiaceae bacterium]